MLLTETLFPTLFPTLISRAIAKVFPYAQYQRRDNGSGKDKQHNYSVGIYKGFHICVSLNLKCGYSKCCETSKPYAFGLVKRYLFKYSGHLCQSYKPGLLSMRRFLVVFLCPFPPTDPLTTSNNNH